MNLVRNVLAFAVVASVSAAALNAADRNARGDDVSGLTGAHTRLVWVQDTSRKSADTFAKGNSLKLMGYDSRDGKGERAIVPRVGSYAKPLLTPDGKRVVYSDRSKGTMHWVGFGDGDVQSLGKGFAADVWQDPKTQTVWVYYQAVSGKRNSPIRRMKLDGPDTDELVWDKTPVDVDNFQVSRDGTRAAGLFPWADAGLAELPNKRWTKTGRGCWTSLAPDDSYLMWIFDGQHRNVRMHRVADDNSWEVGISAAKGIRGFEVYHPRWTNHVRYLLMTGPYLGKGGKPGGNRIRGGGKAVEVYLGKLVADFVSVQQWVQVTDNDHGDFYPDAWIEGGAKSEIPKNVRGWAATVPEEKLGKHDTWPGDERGLLFLWRDVGAGNQFRRDGNTVTCRVQPRGRAIFGRWGSMDTAGGAFTAPDDDKRLLAACRKANRLAIEATIIPANLKQDGPARIVSFSQDSGSRNFTLGQSGDKLVFRLRTPRTGDNGTKPQVTLAKLTAGKPHHVVVSYVPGRLLCSVNGKQTLLTAAVKGGLSNWKPMHLVFGDEYEGDRDWAGRIESVAIYNRFVGPREAKQKYELYAKATKDREKPPTLTVTGKLIEKTATPAIEDLEDYRRALVVYTYEVRKLAGGKYPHKKMLVAHWAVLDRKKLDLDRKIGEDYTMTVEKYDSREELEGERYFSDSEEFDLPVYYDLSR
ncbi:MAG: LamG-like jellyroll fold domain-containing protein [Phycisphaerae bacterium]